MPARQHRVTHGDEYRQILRRGNRVGNAYGIVHAVFLRSEDTERPARFGFIVSKAVGNAVVRNLVRRRLRAIADELLREGFTGVDVVIRALPSSAGAPFQDLRREMRRSLRRLQRRHESGTGSSR